MVYNPYNFNNALKVGAGALSYPFSSRFMTPQAYAFRGHGSSVLTKRRRRRKQFGRSNTFAQRVRNTRSYKHSTVSDQTQTSAMTHNTMYTSSITTEVTQGDGNANRDGDTIYIAALKVKGAIHTATTSGAYTYRLLVGFSGEEYDVSASSAGLTNAEVFLPNTGTLFVTDGIVNPKAFTVLYDTTIDINSIVAATADIQSFDFKVPINQKFQYQASGSTFGKIKNLYVVVIGVVVGGTTGTTACGTFLFGTDLIFQNND